MGIPSIIHSVVYMLLKTFKYMHETIRIPNMHVNTWYNTDAGMIDLCVFPALMFSLQHLTKTLSEAGLSPFMLTSTVTVHTFVHCHNM